MKIDFCLPVRNEENIIGPNIIKVYEYLNSQKYNFDWQIVVILNACDDNSEKIISELAVLNLIKIKYIGITPPGKGGALKYYFSRSSADILVFMDIDLAVSLDNLNSLINPVINNQYDLVIGSRLLESSKVERSYFRSFSSLVYNYISRNILSHNFRDLQCGFKAFKSGLFFKIQPYLKDDNWFFDTELVILARLFKFKTLEIPVNWTENRYAQRVSKVSVYKNALGFIKNSIDLRQRINKLKKHLDNV